MTIIYRKQKKKTKDETPKIKQGLKPTSRLSHQLDGNT